MESKLKALKVVELREIISKANVACPAKAIKADLIASIVASPSAIQVYYELHPPPQSVFLFTSRLEFTSSSQKYGQSGTYYPSGRAGPAKSCAVQSILTSPNRIPC
jgi:hypothetical protein